jgi:hypothetical protein
MSFFLPAPFHNRGVLLVDRHLLGFAEHVELHLVKFYAEVFGDRSTPGQDGDVLQHRLAAIANAGGLDSCHL